MLKNGAHIACAPCSIPSAPFAQFDLTKHKAEEARKAAAAKPAAKPAAAPAAGTDRAAGTCAVDKAALEALDLGDQVFHRAFGYGSVVNLGNNRITVNFDSDGPKKTRQFAYPSAFYQGLLQL